MIPSCSTGGSRPHAEGPPQPSQASILGLLIPAYYKDERTKSEETKTTTVGCFANEKIDKAERKGKKESEGNQGEQAARATSGSGERDRGAWAWTEGDRRGRPARAKSEADQRDWGTRATNETGSEGDRRGRQARATSESGSEGDRQMRQARLGFEGGQRERGHSPKVSSEGMNRRRAEEGWSEGEEGQPAVRVCKTGLDWREEGLDSRRLGKFVK